MRSKGNLAFINNAVYFLTNTNGNKLPKCLGILTISKEVVRDNYRKELFCLLRVQPASPEMVMGLISHHSHATSFALTARSPIADFMHILCYVYGSCTKDNCLKTPCLIVLMSTI
jgi:hypothetical protein